MQILIVDDNREAATSLAQSLALVGHTPVVAFDGITAIELAEKTPPQVILLDIGLPDMNGFEVCRMLRADTRFADTIIAAVTGRDQPGDRDRTQNLGFDAHLVKPVAFDQIQRLIAHLSEEPGGAVH